MLQWYFYRASSEILLRTRLVSDPPDVWILYPRMINPTFARKCIDITWGCLWTFIWRFITQTETASQTEVDIEDLWCPDQTLVAFTVRSGFDLCLQACAFPAGSEIVVSAVTIPDMVRIIEYHELVAVPVDMQDDGSVSAIDVQAVITSKTRAILIAHLFGSRMPFDDIATVAKRNGIMVFEDCAEAFCGLEFTGNRQADVSMFSFGLIKTSTALGGGILTIRNPSLLYSVKSIQSQYSSQTTSKFLVRVAKYAIFKGLTDSAVAYGTFLAILGLFKLDHHVLIRKLSRSFLPHSLMVQIRQRPSAPLLQLLRYRISTFEFDHLKKRQERVACLASLTPEDCRPIGFGQAHHVYWLCPIQVPRPDILLEGLYRAGFDAADGGTSLAVVSSTEHARPQRAEKIMRSVVYLPMDHSYDRKTLKQLADLICLHRKLHGES